MIENTKIYTDIAEKRTTNYNEISRALDMVLNFIIERKLIIYGGMAIDLSLKISGHEGIYAEDALPDYDFMSPDFYNDANILALHLADAGFTNVSSINAQHITTRRVRINFIPVADITYIPQNIYDILPTLEYKILRKKMRVIHPDFQRLDFHRAFSTPFEKPPLEVFLNRAKKDQKRFRLMDQQYPIDFNWEGNTKNMQEFIIPQKYLQNTAIGGVLAYGLFCTIFEAVVPSVNFLLPIRSKFVGENLIISYPSEVGNIIKFNIICDNFEPLAAKISKDLAEKPKYFNRYLDDFRPRTIEIGQYEIFDNQTRKLPVFDCEVKNVFLAQAQYILMYFLLKIYDIHDSSEKFTIGKKHIADKYKNFYLSLYTSLAKMVTEAETLGLREFFLSAQTYGETNWSPDYVNSVREKLAIIENKQIPQLRPIFGFYPEHSRSWDPFNLDSSELFQINGKLHKEAFTPITF